MTGMGYQMMPASQWAKKHKRFYWGQAPVIIREQEETVLRVVGKYRMENPDYSYWALFVVWVSQVTGLKFGTVGNICTSFIQNVWVACGYHLFKGKTIDPGDFRNHCRSIHYVEAA
jgi:hypothetical protein